MKTDDIRLIESLYELLLDHEIIGVNHNLSKETVNLLGKMHEDIKLPKGIEPTAMFECDKCHHHTAVLISDLKNGYPCSHCRTEIKI